MQSAFGIDHGYDEISKWSADPKDPSGGVSREARSRPCRRSYSRCCRRQEGQEASCYG